MSAPERIWHAIDRNGKISGCPDAHVMPCADVQEAYTEYVRADPCATQDERVKRLVELLNEPVVTHTDQWWIDARNAALRDMKERGRP